VPQDEHTIEAKDSNGAVLKDGDSVQLTKDLKVKGTSLNMKRGSVVKNIRLTDNAEEVECRDGRSTIVLKTCFLKKV
jgi:protein PhnA